MGKGKLFIELTRNYYRVNPDYVEQFRREGYEVAFLPSSGQELARISKETILNMIRDCDIASVCILPITEEMMDAAPNLKLITVFGSGVDGVDMAAATKRGIPVVNGRGGGAVAVAEHVVSMMMALARNLPQYHEDMRAGIWKSLMGSELFGKTAGIVGVGAIGGELARILSQGFHMEILAYDVAPNPELAEKYGVRYVEMEELFAQADFVSVHTPLLPSTRGLINGKLFERMKPGAYLINASRGGVVDEDALYAALSAEKIAGAGLDVFAEEPPGKTAFGKLRNVVLSPHVAANTPETVFRISKILEENIQDVLNNRFPGRNVVNREALLKS